MAKAPASRSSTKAAPKAKAESPNAIMARNIRRFAALHAEHKDGEAELDGLKAYFKGEAGGADAIFVDGDVEVVVTREERTGWDGEALEKHLGADAGALKKTSSFQKVTCRKAKVVA